MNRKDAGINHIIPIYNPIPPLFGVSGGESESLPTDLIKENKSLERLSQEGNLEKAGQEKKNEKTHIIRPISSSKHRDTPLHYQSRYQKNKGRLFRICIL